MLLRWYNRQCIHVPYLLKCDDDVFLNTKNLHNLVSNINMDDVLTGYLLCDNKPERNSRLKTYIPESVYSEETFPPQLMGGGYLISSSAAQKLFRAARHVPWFVWEDVYLTGMVARAAGITPYDHNDFYQYFPIDACAYSQIILVPTLTINEITRITKEVENLDKVECRNRGVMLKRPQAPCHKRNVPNWRNYPVFQANHLLYKDQ